MKRYLLFNGDHFYPSGGWDDFLGDYDTYEEAKNHIIYNDWVQIIDSETKIDVYKDASGEDWQPISQEEKEKFIQYVTKKGFIRPRDLINNDTQTS